MSTIEDKILDGPRIHYCDAEDDDVRTGEVQEDGDSKTGRENNSSSIFTKPDEDSERLSRLNQRRIPGCSTNTGPKGVIEDHRKGTLRYKQSSNDELEAEFQELLADDSILKDFISKRLAQDKSAPSFGHVFRLQTGSELLDAIDKEDINVTVIVHIYAKYSKSCTNVDRCLDELARELKHVKFVTLDAGVAGLSANFKENGVPALLAYKNGNLVKSLVQLEEYLDRDFDASQIKELLINEGVV